MWKCCLSIRTAASEMRRIKINVKDRNDGSLSFRLPCVHPNNSLAYHNLPFVHFVWTVSGSQGPRGPAGPPPRLFGIRSLPCGASEYITLTPGGCQQVISDFFEIPLKQPCSRSRAQCAMLLLNHRLEGKMVEMRGLEPPTPTLRTWCSPS